MFFEKGANMTLANPGYHLVEIDQGVLGETSKVYEECCELIDATGQGVALMELQEASDIIGSLKAWLAKHHPSVTLHDLEVMAEVTKRAFRSGRRR